MAISAMLKRLLSAFESRRKTDEALPAAANADVASLLRGAEEALRAKRLDEAQERLESLLKSHHDCAEAHLLFGDVYSKLGHIDDARDSYILAECFKSAWSLPLIRRGLLELNEGQLNEAIVALNRALNMGVRDAKVHNALGAAYLKANQFESARQHLEMALAFQPDLPEAHSNLGLLLFRDLERYDEGASHVERALRLKPDDESALCNWLMVLQYLGRSEEALALCSELLRRNASMHEVRFMRGVILLSKGDYSSGWADYELRKSVRSNYEARFLPWPEWSGSDLRGKTIYVHMEQGLGDQIMFASCLPDLIARAGKCICECSPQLHRVLAYSFPAALIVGKDAWREPSFSRLHRPDVQVAIGSLPRFFRGARKDFPAHAGYLGADPVRVAYWRERLGHLPGRKKVGISWRGGAPSTRRSLRSIPLREWQQILELDQICFVSLQYSDCREELSETLDLGRKIAHWQDAVDDYTETAALVSALDLVVSVQTSVVHLAGALGKPAWALITAVPEWRYGGEAESTPWYPSVRLIRQSSVGEWDETMERLCADLSAWSST